MSDKKAHTMMSLENTDDLLSYIDDERAMSLETITDEAYLSNTDEIPQTERIANSPKNNSNAECPTTDKDPLLHIHRSKHLSSPSHSPKDCASDNNRSPRSRSPLIRQNATETTNFSFEEEECRQEITSLARRRSSTFLRQISAHLLEGECITEEYNEEPTCSNIVTYLDHAPEEVRRMVATYLSCGKLGKINLTVTNYHYFLHVATSLNLKKLRAHCMEFCSENNHREIISIIGECECRAAVEQEAEGGYLRTVSVLSDPDDSLPPEYYIVFTKDSAAKEKIRVLVIDMSERLGILQREMEKPYQFGDGFSCCSVELKDSPFIFVSGGEGKCMNYLWKYDVLLCRWTKSAKLLHGRSHHGMVSVDNKLIYVIGGQEVPCIEKYTIKSNTWTECASLTVPVHAAITIVYQQKIYIFGGKTPAGLVSSVQCYDVGTKSVQSLHDLPVPCSDGQAVIIGNRIFIASGHGHMICFEPHSGLSHLCSQQPLQRCHFGMFVKNERVYLVGGVPCEDEDGDTDADNTPQYRYNPEKDSWVQKYKLNKCFPVYAHCIIKYPRRCPIVPFEIT